MFASVTIFTFCFAISRAHARAMSLSSSGRICGSASNRWTSVPSRPNAEATSVPDAPAPTTASFAGCSSSAHIVSVDRTRLPNWRPRIGLGTEPQASTTLSVSITVPSNWPPIFTFASSSIEPNPSITSTLFFLSSPATPPVSFLTTSSRWLVTPAKLTFTSPTSIPNCAPLRASLATSAALSTALAGMHA